MTVPGRRFCNETSNAVPDASEGGVNGINRTLIWCATYSDTRRCYLTCQVHRANCVWLHIPASAISCVCKILQRFGRVDTGSKFACMCEKEGFIHTKHFLMSIQPCFPISALGRSVNSLHHSFNTHLYL